LMNLGRPAGLSGLILTGLPALVGLWLWFRRGAGQELGRAVWLPLAAGAVAALALGVVTIWSALLDGRAAWMSLPMGAVLVATWRRPTGAAERPPARRSLVRLVTFASLGGVALLAVMVGAGVLAPKSTAYEPDLRTRLVEPGQGPVTWSTTRGRGPGTVDLANGAPAGTALEVSFDASEPMVLTGPGLSWMAAGPGVRHGTVLIDTPIPPTLGVRTGGSWQVTVRPVAAAVKSPEGGYQEWTGSGPAILTYPTGVNSPFRLRLESSDPRASVQLVGHCRLGSCGPSQRGVVTVPIGTEVLVVQSSGSWRLAPLGFSDSTRTLDGTVKG
jgi:hypothetical protein